MFIVYCVELKLRAGAGESNNGSASLDRTLRCVHSEQHFGKLHKWHKRDSLFEYDRACVYIRGEFIHQPKVHTHNRCGRIVYVCCLKPNNCTHTVRHIFRHVTVQPQNKCSQYYVTSADNRLDVVGFFSLLQ